MTFGEALSKVGHYGAERYRQQPDSLTPPCSLPREFVAAAEANTVMGEARVEALHGAMRQGWWMEKYRELALENARLKRELEEARSWR